MYREEKVTFHNAAAADGNGQIANTAGFSAVGIQIKGASFVSTVYFEATIDGTNWVGVLGTNCNTGEIATSSAAEGLWQVPLLTYRRFRARLDWTSGTATVTGIFSEGDVEPLADVYLAAGAAIIGSLAASELHIGEVGTSSIGVSNTPTVTAGAYTALDIVGGVQALANTHRVSGEAVVLQSVVIRDKAVQDQAMTLFFFNANPTNGTYTDNTALTIHDTDLAMCIGAVRVLAADYTPASANSVATVANIGLQLRSAATGMWVIAQCTGTAPTYAATADLTFVYEFMPD